MSTVKGGGWSLDLAYLSLYIKPQIISVAHFGSRVSSDGLSSDRFSQSVSVLVSYRQVGTVSGILDPPQLSMSGEPSSSELTAFTSLYDVACWSGLSGEHDDPTEPFGSLLMLLGATWDMPPHTVGMVTEAGFDVAIASWIVGAGVGDKAAHRKAFQTHKALSASKLRKRLIRDEGRCKVFNHSCFSPPIVQ